MKDNFVCICCPNGCALNVSVEAGNISVEGALCKLGEEYAVQEMTSPCRVVTSSVMVKGGELPLASVRLTKAVPKEKIFDIMEEIKKIVVIAPVKSGDVLVKSILGFDSNLIVTKNVEACVS